MKRQFHLFQGLRQLRLWNPASGTDGRNDTQCTGGMADIFFIPQKPGLPSPMSLREAVSFPHSADHFRDEDIRDVLQRVGLEFAPGLVTWQ